MKKNPLRHLPNLISWTRLPLGILFFYTFSQIPANFCFSWLSLTIIVTSGITDFLDGHLARRLNFVSFFGKWFDPINDLIFFLMVYVSLFTAQLIPFWIVLLFILREGIMYIYIRPTLLRLKLEISAKLSGKIKTVGNFTLSIGLIIPYALTVNSLQFPVTQQIITILFALQSSYSLISLFWYLKPIYLKQHQS